MRPLFTTLLSMSCGPSSENDTVENQYTVGDLLLVQSFSYSRTEDNETIRMKEDYNYEDRRLISRVETNLDSDSTRTFSYTYDDDLISDIQIHNGNANSSEIKYYNGTIRSIPMNTPMT